MSCDLCASDATEEPSSGSKYSGVAGHEGGCDVLPSLRKHAVNSSTKSGIAAVGGGGSGLFTAVRGSGTSSATGGGGGGQSSSLCGIGALLTSHVDLL